MMSIINKRVSKNILETFQGIIKDESDTPFIKGIPDALQRYVINKINYHMDNNYIADTDNDSIMAYIVTAFKDTGDENFQFVTDLEFKSIVIAFLNLPKVLKTTYEDSRELTYNSVYWQMKSDAIIMDTTQAILKWTDGNPIKPERQELLVNAISLLSNWRENSAETGIIDEMTKSFKLR